MLYTNSAIDNDKISCSEFSHRNLKNRDSKIGLNENGKGIVHIL